MSTKTMRDGRTAAGLTSLEAKRTPARTGIDELPPSWQSARLGDVVTRVGSGITPTGGAHVYSTEGRPFVRSQNVGWGGLELDDLVFLSDNIHETFPASEIVAGDVLLNITGASIGRSAVADSRIAGGNVNQHVCEIRTDRKMLNPWFLNCFLLSARGQRQIDSFQAGGNRQGLNYNQVRSFLVPCPPVAEQSVIAEALSDVDGLLGALEALIAKKRAIKQAAMQQLLTGKTRLPGFSGEWETKRLGEISTIAIGRTPSRANAAFWGRGHVWLSIADLQTKVVDSSNEEVTDLAASGMHVVPVGTLLMSFKLSIGRLCFAGCDLFTNEAICSFADLRVDANFLYYALSRTDFSLYGKQAVKGYTLNSESLKQVQVSLPGRGEQTAIAAVLSDLDAELSALEARREKTRAIKQGMMQQLLTGRIRLVAPTPPPTTAPQ